MNDRNLSHADLLVLAKGRRRWTELAKAMGCSAQQAQRYYRDDFVPEHRRQAVIDFSEGRVKAADFALPYEDRNYADRISA